MLHLHQKKSVPCEMDFITQYIEFTRKCVQWSQECLSIYRKQLLKACADGNLLVITCLLNQGWSTEIATKNRYTLLLIASAHGQAEAVELLLSRGANVHARQKNQLTALQIAQARRHTNVEKVLEEYFKKQTQEVPPQLKAVQPCF